MYGRMGLYAGMWDGGRAGREESDGLATEQASWIIGGRTGSCGLAGKMAGGRAGYRASGRAG